MSEERPYTSSFPIVVLTGAGISKESGLDTFRDKGGIWEKVSIEEVATPEAFQANPERVQQFYNDRRRQLTQDRPEPNEGHKALARLEREWPGEVLVVTQNIDDLHARAGQRNLIHMHGELRKARCTDCEAVVAQDADLDAATGCPHCDTGRLRPHVVWFGEMPFEMDRIFDACSAADCSCRSAPRAASIPPPASCRRCCAAAARTVELNLEPSDGSVLFHEVRHGPASEVVPRFVDDLLAGRLDL